MNLHGVKCSFYALNCNLILSPLPFYNEKRPSFMVMMVFTIYAVGPFFFLFYERSHLGCFMRKRFFLIFSSLFSYLNSYRLWTEEALVSVWPFLPC